MGTKAEQITPFITEKTAISASVYRIIIGKVVSSLVAPATATHVYELRYFATNGIAIKEAISLIRLLKKATLPTEASAKLFSVRLVLGLLRSFAGSSYRLLIVKQLSRHKR